MRQPQVKTNPLFTKREEIMEQLGEAYYVLIDSMEFREEVIKVITSCNASMMRFDLQTNTSVTTKSVYQPVLHRSHDACYLSTEAHCIL